MIRFTRLPLVACCFIQLLSFARGGETHLFILSGQSNMAGLKEARDNSFLSELAI